MRIGVTGGTGFIGGYLLRDYADKYEFVVATSRESANAGNSVEFRHCDYTYESYLDVFSGCDAIVHLGAKAPNSVTAIGQMADYTENIVSSENIFRAAAKLGISNIVDISSVSVYEKSAPQPFHEEDTVSPDNCYGISKVAVELLASLYEKKYNIMVKTLRVSQVLGYRKYKNKGFFSMLLENACAGKAITLYGDGHAARDYIYVKDVVNAIVCALEHPEVSGVFNVGTGVPTSNLQLAEAYVEAFELSAGIVRVPSDVKDDRNWYMDVSRAAEKLGFVAQYDTLAMVKDIRKEWIAAGDK